MSKKGFFSTDYVPGSGYKIPSTFQLFFLSDYCLEATNHVVILFLEHKQNHAGNLHVLVQNEYLPG